MPIYAYRCTACATEFEALVRSGDTPPDCPDCGASNPQRCLSRVAPPGQSAKLLAGARRQAAAEGHFSNYSKSERTKGKV